MQFAKAQGGKKTGGACTLELMRQGGSSMPDMGGTTCFIPGLDKARQEAAMAPTTLGYSKIRLKRQSVT